MAEGMTEEELRELRKKMLEWSEKSLSEAIGHVVAVAAGALALLVTFRGSLLTGRTSQIWALKVSWAGLALAVVAAVWSRMLYSDVMADAAEDAPATRRLLFFLDAVDWLGRGSLTFFAIGVVALAYFGLVNL